MRRRKNTTHRESSALSWAPVLEKIDDLAGRAGFAQLREDARNAVAVSIRVHVGHRIDSEDHVETEKPFCRSMTMRAMFGSMMVTVTVLAFHGYGLRSTARW